MSLKKAWFLIVLIILIDQIVKIYVKTHFLMGEYGEVEVFSWFRLHFIENEGMAWGTEIPGQYGKLFLTIFRLIVVPAIIYWLYDSIKNKGSKYLIVAISLILAGAVGNIIDSVFYGVIFDTPMNGTATLFAPKPYGHLFYGKVVDMFYFPIFEFDFPNGYHFKFFNAIFNVADFAISVGIGILIVFNKSSFAVRKDIVQNDKTSEGVTQ
jgi:signal peptidase II